MTFELKWLLLFGGLGVFSTAVGWAAWTGRYRGWARRGLGYRTLLMLPGGIAFLLLAIAPFLPRTLGAVAFGLALLFGLLAFLYLVATLFVKDRWYPHWYHELPPDERTW
ncbi:MAG: hypothetical protein M3O70_22395 [Actinomycetota bacterium]|nr:hypothetical protein [Actinomycetota bacterium]